MTPGAPPTMPGRFGTTSAGRSSPAAAWSVLRSYSSDDPRLTFHPRREIHDGLGGDVPVLITNRERLRDDASRLQGVREVPILIVSGAQEGGVGLRDDHPEAVAV